MYNILPYWICKKNEVKGQTVIIKSLILLNFMKSMGRWRKIFKGGFYGRSYAMILPPPLLTTPPPQGGLLGLMPVPYTKLSKRNLDRIYRISYMSNNWRI